MRRLRLLVVVLIVGCTRQPEPQPERSAMPAFVDDYFKALFEWSPSTATSIGFHEYDSRIEDYSAASVNRRIDKLKQLQSGLAQARGGRLAADEQIDAEILDDQI